VEYHLLVSIQETCYNQRSVTVPNVTLHIIYLHVWIQHTAAEKQFVFGFTCTKSDHYSIHPTEPHTEQNKVTLTITINQ